jgi:hypothetical protein
VFKRIRCSRAHFKSGTSISNPTTGANFTKNPQHEREVEGCFYRDWFLRLRAVGSRRPRPPGKSSLCISTRACRGEKIYLHCMQVCMLASSYTGNQLRSGSNCKMFIEIFSIQINYDHPHTVHFYFMPRLKVK